MYKLQNILKKVISHSILIDRLLRILHGVKDDNDPILDPPSIIKCFEFEEITNPLIRDDRLLTFCGGTDDDTVSDPVSVENSLERL